MAAAGDLPKDASLVRYSVEGMTCGSCALKIREVVEQLKGVKMVLVHMDGTMEVAFDDKLTNADAIMASATTAGEYKFKKV
ncbi:MAG TPA: heavy metal transporter [Deltaproteobacteria bacterium]|nr:heavy metal transporter [Deltaproteobacteria bacterium]HCP45703.1 heavy metal transporter [Deltaproteobacteria bacterium]